MPAWMAGWAAGDREANEAMAVGGMWLAPPAYAATSARFRAGSDAPHVR